MALKEKLFVLTALVILSSITGIFFNMPLSISAQQFTMDDSTNTGDNEISVLSGDKKHKDKRHDDRDFKKFTCPSGIVVDKEANCPQVCPPMSDFEGHLVAAGITLEQACNDGNNLDLEICTGNVDLVGVAVENAPEDCNIFFTCPGQPTDEVANPNPYLADAKVTDPRLCESAAPAVLCPDDSGLPGVFVNASDPLDSCNPQNGDGEVTEFQVQCLKCADLAIVDSGGQNQHEDVAVEGMIGNTTNNVFTICDNEETAEAEFNDTINDLVDTTTLNQQQADTVIDDFELCLDNVAAQGGANLGVQSLGLESSMQENSFTTNVAPEPEIPTTSSPSAQQTEDFTLIPKWLMEELVE